MYYDKKLNELELIAGAYRYLEDLAKKYSTKYKSFDDYVFSLDNCEYNIATPELVIKFCRIKNRSIEFSLNARIKYSQNKFHYEITHFNHNEDRKYTSSNEEDMIEKFEKFLKADCKYVMQQDRKKTLKAINSLAG